MSTMPLPRRRLLKLAAATLALTSLAAPALTPVARAQTYPSRPITMIVPYTAGGPTDTVGRVVAERMRAELGQSVVLENVAGADHVLDDDLLAEGLRHVVRDDAGDDVGRPAGRERNDHGDRAGRIGLCLGG